MDKATIVGYHGRRNFGDDLFLEWGCKWLHKNFRIRRAYVAGFVGQIPSQCYGVELHAYQRPNSPISRFVWIQTVYYSLRSDILLFCAGSIFTVQPFLLAFIAIKAIKVFNPNIVVMAVGVSIGPLRSKFDRFWCAKLLRSFDEILLRDKRSEILAEEIDPKLRVLTSFDLALLCEPKAGLQRGEADRTIAICLNRQVIDRQSRGTEQTFLEMLVSEIRASLDRVPSLGVAILVVCTDPRDGDMEVAIAIRGALARSRIQAELILYDGKSPMTFASQLVLYDAIVSSRMHPSILAMMQGVPVLQIAYAPKIVDFYEHCGLGSELLVLPEDLSPDCLRQFLSDCLECRLTEQVTRRRLKLEVSAKCLESALSELALRRQ